MDWGPHMLLQIPPKGGGLGVTERGVFFLELVSPSAPALLCNCCRKGPCPKDKHDLLLFEVIAQSPGKSVSGRQDLSKQEIFRFAMSCPMKFWKFPLWDALGETPLGVCASRGERYILRKSQKAES